MNILNTIKEKYYKVIDYYKSIGFNQDLSDIWQVMVTLLNRLSKNYPFEEIYYYQNKLNEYDSKRNN